MVDKQPFCAPEVFLDGVVDIWALNSVGYPSTLYSSLHFQRRVVGSRRAYDALLAGHTVQMVIWVPLPSLPENAELYVLLRGVQYHVLQMQILPDRFPRVCQLTLEQSNMLWERNRSITLIQYSYADDALHQQIPVESRTDTVCTVRRMNSSIRDSDGVYGLFGSITAAVPAAIYNGQSTAVYDGKIYKISAVSSVRSDIVELTLEESTTGGEPNVGYR